MKAARTALGDRVKRSKAFLEACALTKADCRLPPAPRENVLSQKKETRQPMCM